MKKLLYIGFAALTALALSSCQKETQVDDTPNMVTVTLRADKAGDATKAVAVEGEGMVSYLWTDADVANLKLFVVTGEADGNESLTEVEDPTINVSSDNRFLSITATVEENSTLRAIVSSDWTTSETDPKPRLLVKQNPTLDNFDADADILVADDVTVSGLDEEMLSFHRPVTVNKMTLVGLGNGEIITEVILSSTKELTGFYNYGASSMAGQKKELTLKYENAAASSDGEFPVYFVAMPNEGQTITLTVKTLSGPNKYRYTKEFGTVNFTQGKFSQFSVDLYGCDEEIIDGEYAGEWVIYGVDNEKTFAAKASTGNYYEVSPVSLEDGVLSVTGDADPYKMTINYVNDGEYIGLYTIVDADGKYLSAVGGTSSNYLKGLDTPDETSYWSIDKLADGTYDILAAKLEDEGARNSMRYNATNPRVSCYGATTNQSRVLLYPFENVVAIEIETNDAFDSDVTWKLVSSAYTQEAIVNGTEGVSILKLGTGSKFGSATLTLPSASSKLSFYAVSWNNAKVADLVFKVGDKEVARVTPAANSGLTGSKLPYVMTVSDSDYFTINLGADVTTVTVETDGGYRAALFGIQAK